MKRFLGLISLAGFVAALLVHVSAASENIGLFYFVPFAYFMFYRGPEGEL